MDFIERYGTETLLLLNSAIFVMIAASAKKILALNEAVPFLVCLTFEIGAFAIICCSLIALKRERKLSEFGMGMALALIITLPIIAG